MSNILNTENSKTTEKTQRKNNKLSYSPLINAKGSNGLTKLPIAPNSIKARFVLKPENNNGLFSTDDLKVTISNFDNVSYIGKSILFLFYCLKEFTKDIPSKNINKGIDYNKFRANLTNKDSRTISINFDDYLTSFNIPNTPDSKKNARRTLKSYFDTLKNTTFEFTDYSYKAKAILDYSLKILSGEAKENSEIKRSGDIYFIFNFDFISYLTENNFITYIADKTFTIDLKKHPNALAIIFKLSVMYSMNYLKDNKGIISVKDLLNDILNLPSYEDVKKSGKSPFSTIIEPLERDLDYLRDYGLIKWEYCNKKKESLTNKQLNNYSYKELIACYINYELTDYPEEIQEKRKQALAEKKETAKKSNSRKAKTDSKK